MTSAFFTTYVVIWIVVLFQGLLILALLRELAELRRRLELGALENEDRLPIGSEAPEFTGADVRSGQLVSLQTVGHAGGAILFLTPDCNLCRNLANSLRAPALSDLPTIIVFCQGSERGCSTFYERLDPKGYLMHKESEQVATLYHVSGSPTAVILDGERKIRGYGHPQDLEDLKKLLTRALRAEFESTKIETDSQPVILSSTVAQ
jgi:hypothetical protein